MQTYSRPNKQPKCKHVSQCKKHAPKPVRQPKVSALVILFDEKRKTMPISKPAKTGIHYELSLLSIRQERL